MQDGRATQADAVWQGRQGRHRILRTIEPQVQQPNPKAQEAQGPAKQALSWILPQMAQAPASYMSGRSDAIVLPQQAPQARRQEAQKEQSSQRARQNADATAGQGTAVGPSQPLPARSRHTPHSAPADTTLSKGELPAAVFQDQNDANVPVATASPRTDTTPGTATTDAAEAAERAWLGRPPSPPPLPFVLRLARLPVETQFEVLVMAGRRPSQLWRLLQVPNGVLAEARSKRSLSFYNPTLRHTVPDDDMDLTYV